MEQRNFDAALGDLSKSLDLAEDTGMEAWGAAIRGSMALTQFELGADGSIADLRAAIQAAYDFGDDYTGITLSQKLARALVRLDQLDEAATLLDRATQFYRERNMLPNLEGALALRASLEDKRGNAAAAAQYHGEAAALSERMSHPGAPAETAATAPAMTH
jgi:tetratricopeptide (TPR) repeat protein